MFGADPHAMGDQNVCMSVLLPLARVGEARPLAAAQPKGVGRTATKKVVGGGPPMRLQKTIGDQASNQALGRALESLATTATRPRHLMTLSIEYAVWSVYQASASKQDFLDALPLVLVSGSHGLSFKTTAMTISVRVARTEKTAVTCVAKFMADDAL